MDRSPRFLMLNGCLSLIQAHSQNGEIVDVAGPWSLKAEPGIERDVFIAEVNLLLAQARSQPILHVHDLPVEIQARIKAALTPAA